MLDFHAQSRTVAHDRDDHGMHGIQEVGSSTLLGSIDLPVTWRARMLCRLVVV
jgi:hypothetical protein